MTWTTEKPSKPGWYWYRESKGEPEILSLYKDDGQLFNKRNWLTRIPGRMGRSAGAAAVITVKRLMELLAECTPGAGVRL
ncbi:MAG: hypothetical protein E6K65_00575 [Nitrospirae bacterium]|nr:MAG: hypothetical protein E6K65_00575 [Nitrospirota bacterium]